MPPFSQFSYPSAGPSLFARPFARRHAASGGQNLHLFFTAVWLLYILLSPLYIFPKGMPQPADYILFFAGFPALLMSIFTHKGSVSKVFLYGALFAGLTLTVNMIHFLNLPNDRLIKHSVYYIFNFGAFMYALLIFRQSPEQVNRLTYIVLAAAIIFQALYAPFFGEISVLRNMGSFNNPNQLSYWCVLSMAMLVVLKRNSAFTLFDLALFAMLIYLQTLSLSKAGLIVTALMVPFIITLPNLPAVGRMIALFGLVVFFLTQTLDHENLQQRLTQVAQITAVLERVQNIGTEGDDSASGRGYDRLLRYPHYMVFGAGEGAFFRFGIGAQELHSGLATLLFCYGVTGFSFFLIFVGAVLYRLPARYVVLVGLVFLFGIPHQSIRFTHFWIFLALVHTHTLFYSRTVRGQAQEQAREWSPPQGRKKEK